MESFIVTHSSATGQYSMRKQYLCIHYNCYTRYKIRYAAICKQYIFHTDTMYSIQHQSYCSLQPNASFLGTSICIFQAFSLNNEKFVERMLECSAATKVTSLSTTILAIFPNGTPPHFSLE